MQTLLSDIRYAFRMMAKQPGFAVLGVAPQLGRDFAEADDVPNGPKVALISDKVWRTRFGASREVLGKQLFIDSVPYEIIGVLPSIVKLPRLAEIFVTLGDVRG